MQVLLPGSLFCFSTAWISELPLHHWGRAFRWVLALATHSCPMMDPLVLGDL